MIEAIIVTCALGAAIYLLHPLLRRQGGGGRLLLILLPLLLGASIPSETVQAMTRDTSIGLLLIAVDVQRDHLRISEALRVVNPGPPRAMDLTITLPPGAVYLTVHRGMDAVRPAPGGFSGRVVLPRGVREVVYSYALPAGRRQRITRSFPLPSHRVEIVVRGDHVQMTGSRGGALEEMEVGGLRLPRWEIREVIAGESVVVDLGGLPVSRPWFPRAVASVFAIVLAAGLAVGAAGRVFSPHTEVEESSPVRRT